MPHENTRSTSVAEAAEALHNEATGAIPRSLDSYSASLREDLEGQSAALLAANAAGTVASTTAARDALDETSREIERVGRVISMMELVNGEGPSCSS